MAGGTTWREMEERDTLERGMVVWARKHTWNKLNINTASSSCRRSFGDWTWLVWTLTAFAWSVGRPISNV